MDAWKKPKKPLAALLLLLWGFAATAAAAKEEICVNDDSMGKDIALFESYVRQGQWACASQYVSTSEQGTLLGLKSMLDLEQRRYVAELTSLRSTIDAALPTARIVPAFQWCQSVSHIYLSVKFSHKLDAPATLNVQTDTITIESNRLVLAASATKGSSKNFHLEFPLFAAIVPEESTHTEPSGGRMTFTLKKSQTDVKWGKLVERSFKAQQKLGKSVMHFWHDMHARYVEELDLLDDEEDDEDDKKRKKKAREKLAKKKKEEEEKEKKEKEEKEKKEEGSAAADEKKKVEEGEKEDPVVEDVKEALLDQATNAKPAAAKEPTAAELLATAKKEAEDRYNALIKDIDSTAKQQRRDLDFEIVEKKGNVEKNATSRKAAAKERRDSEIRKLELGNTGAAAGAAAAEL